MKNAVQMALVHVIKNCNSPCSMCDCWKTKGITYLSLERLKPIFSDLKKLDTKMVMISGGEPLLHPELKDIFLHLKELELRPSLNTNGTLLRQKMSELSGLVDHIVVSLDASHAQLYREIRGCDKFDEVVANLRNIKEKYPAIKLEIRVTLMRKNIFDFTNIIRLAQNIGVDGIGISPADYSSHSFARSSIDASRNMEQMIPSLEELEKWEEVILNDEIVKESFAKGLISWNTNNFSHIISFFRKIRQSDFNPKDNELCFFPHTSILVDYGGELRNCFYSDPFATIDKYSLDQITASENLKKLESQKRCYDCRGCVFT